MKRLLALALALLFLFSAPLSAGAAEGAQEKYVYPVTRVLLSRYSASLYSGRSVQLLTKVLPISRAYETIQWSSSNESVATVSESGVISTLKAGVALITATADGVSASCSLTVKDVPIKGIRLSNSAIAIGVGDSFPLTVSAVKPSNAPMTGFSYMSQNPGVARVDAESGVVTAVTPGDTVVTVSAGARSASCRVSVTEETQVRVVHLSQQAASLAPGAKLILTATAYPLGASGREISFSSSNSAVASVDQTGLVVAGSRTGVATIRASTANGRSADCKISVKAVPVTGVSLSEKEITLSAGEEKTLYATVSPASAAQSVSWSSSDSAVVSVTGGVVKALSPGVATITATAGSGAKKKSAACYLRVKMLGGSSVIITAGGDVTIGGDPRRDGTLPASEAYYDILYSQYGGNFLGGLQSVTGLSNEISFVNLEGTLTSASKSARKPYVFRGKPAYASVLSGGGIEVVGLANNHVSDFGAAGYASTKSALTSAGVGFCGNGAVYKTTVNGVSVGFCAFYPTGGDSIAKMKRTVSYLAGECDIVVAGVHWGVEYAYVANQTQRNYGRAAVLAGADLVVGHHSHVVSGIEKYRGKYIVYGLGTLSSAVATPKDMDAILFRQKFLVSAGYVDEGEAEIVPVSMSTNHLLISDANDAKPLLLTGDEAERVKKKVRYYSRNFAQTLNIK